jgi:hypothetical protein
MFFVLKRFQRGSEMMEISFPRMSTPGSMALGQSSQYGLP